MPPQNRDKLDASDAYRGDQWANESLACRRRWDQYSIRRTIPFLGSARVTEGAFEYQAAHQLAYKLAQYFQTLPASARPCIVTGGGPGIMEASNRGAYEAGSLTVGLATVNTEGTQPVNPYCHPEASFVFHSLSLRTFWLLERACALVVFPGGFGTLSELLELCTLLQTHMKPPIPIVLFGSAFWESVVDWDLLIRSRYIDASSQAQFYKVDQVDKAVSYLKNLLGLNCNP